MRHSIAAWIGRRRRGSIRRINRFYLSALTVRNGKSQLFLPKLEAKPPAYFGVPSFASNVSFSSNTLGPSPTLV